MTPADIADPAVAALRARADGLAAPVPGKPDPDRAALLDAVRAAGAGVAEGPDRAALRDILYRLTAQRIVEAGRFEGAPTLEPFAGAAAEAAPVPAPAPPLSAAEAPARLLSRARARLSKAPPPEPEPAPDARRLGFEAARFQAMAAQWRDAGAAEDDGALLSGEALVLAARHAEDDPDIAAFVDASRRAEARRSRRRRTMTWAVRALVAAVMILAIGAGWTYRGRALAVAAQAEAERERADAERGRSAALALARDAERDRATGLQAALDAQTAQIRRGVDQALAALAEGNADPTRDFLRGLAGETPAPGLDRLTVAKARPGETADESGASPEALIHGQTRLLAALTGPAAFGAALPTLTPPAPAPPVVLADPLPDLGRCTAAMWLGDGAGLRLAGRPDPGALAVGDTLRIATPSGINLRTAMPDAADYTLGLVKGVAPDGGIVTLTDAPRTYVRPDGSPRYWAQIDAPRQFCSYVYLQVAGLAGPAPVPDGTAETPAPALGPGALGPGALGPGETARVRALDRAIETRGYVVPDAEANPNARGMAELRYYWAEDRPLAEDIVAAIAAAVPAGRAITLVPQTDLPVRPGPGVIELWTDLTPAIAVSR